jgi:hypothetical protein
MICDYYLLGLHAVVEVGEVESITLEHLAKELKIQTFSFQVDCTEQTEEINRDQGIF